jgi:Methane oxygenase PmoA
MRGLGIRAAAVLVCATSSAVGASPSFEITVAAGRHERKNVPVRVPVPPGRGGEAAASVTVSGPDGKSIPGQWTSPGLLSRDGGEIHFILPHLSPGESVRLKATLSSDPPPAAAGFTWRDHPGDHIDLFLGKRAVVTYHYHPLDESSKTSRDRTYKVFHHLYSPQGDRVVTNGLPDDPKIHSPHHRGLFYGFNRISYGNGKTADLWHCTNGSYQEHDRFLASEAGPVLGRHRVAVSWHGEDKKTFAEEERELTVYNVPGGQLVEFASRLKSPAGPVRLDGDPQHAGFQFRAHNDVDAKTSKETIYVRTDGVGQPGESRNWDPKTRRGPVNLPWNAMSFVLDGKRYTVAYLDHPKNPKEARYSEREFGRFGSYFEYTIDEGKPLTVNYRLWLQEGLMKPDDVAALSNDFVDRVRVTVQARR